MEEAGPLTQCGWRPQGKMAGRRRQGQPLPAPREERERRGAALCLHGPRGPADTLALDVWPPGRWAQTLLLLSASPLVVLSKAGLGQKSVHVPLTLPETILEDAMMSGS